MFGVVMATSRPGASGCLGAGTPTSSATYCSWVWTPIVPKTLFNGVGFLLLLSADSFADFLRYEFLLGVGVSLISGADLALLYDSDAQLGGANRSLSRLISIEAGASGVAGIFASLLLVYSNMQALLLLQAIWMRVR